MLAAPGVCMGTTVNVGINVSSNGTTDNETKKALKLKDVLVQASAAGSKINTGGGAGGGGGMGGGSRAAALVDYGTQRAISVGTGAGARDFAKESEGLGGLVRVYATFAANVYAVGAAFSAMSAAMDTANMVKGLDQLGAASGRSLGYLAKSLVSVTGGAISLRESMDTVAKGSAAGLSSDQIMRMGKAATTASQALGVSLPDAMSRISRGISKLEPELLDEIGLYTKLGQSTSAYAQSIGKSVSQLTDFEKRQAYANAVLTEAEQKFGKIKIDTNPYTKLASSFTNMIQSGLELVNKVLTPIVSLLAASPTALVLVLGSIGSILLKQAIPAFGQLTQAIQAASDKALIDVAKKSTPYKQKLVIDQAAIIAQAEKIAELNISALDKAERKFLKTTDAGKTVKVRGILAKPAGDISESDIGYLTARSEKHKDTNEKLSKTYSDLAINVRKYKDSEGAATEAIKEGRRRAADAAVDSKNRMLADIDFQNQSISAVQKSMSVKAIAALKEHGYWKSLTVAITEYKAARLGSTLSLPTGEFEKTKGGKDKLKGGQKIPVMQEVAVAPAGKLQAGMGALGAVASSTASAISGVVGKLGAYDAAAMVAYELGSFVVSMLSDTNKESQATADSLDRLSAATKTVSDTLADINSRPMFERLSIESINARTVAFGELSISLSGMLKAANQEMDKMGKVDKTIDWFKGLFNMDVQSKAAKGFAESVQSAFEAAAPSDATTALKADVKRVMGVDINDIKGMEAAFLTFGGSASTAVTKVKDNIAKLSKEQQVASATATELKENWKQSAKDFDAFINSALPQDALSKIGQNMMADAAKLDAALKNPITALATMKELANDPNFLKLFPESAAKTLASYSDELNTLGLSSQSANNQIIELDKAIQALNEQKNVLDSLAALSNTPEYTVNIELNADPAIAELDKKIADKLKEKKRPIDLLADIKAKENDIKGVFKSALQDQFVAGASILSAKIGEAWAKAGTTVSSAIAGLLGDSAAAITIKADNDRSMIRTQMDSIRSGMNLIIATDKLATQIELDRIGRTKANWDKFDSPEERKLVTDREQKLKDKLANYESKTPVGLGEKGGSDAMIKEFKNAKPGESKFTREDINLAQSLEASMAALAQKGAEFKAVNIGEQVANMKKFSDIEIKSLETTKTKNAEELAGLTALTTGGKILSDVQVTRKAVLESEQESLNTKQLIMAIENKISINESLSEKLTGAKAESLQEVLRLENQRLKTIDIAKLTSEERNKLLGIEAGKNKTLLDNANTRLQYETDTNKIIAGTEYSDRSSELEASSLLLENQKAMDTLLPDEYRNRKLILDLANEQLNSDKAKNSLTDKYIADINAQTDLYTKTNSEEGKTAIELRIAALANEFGTELDGIAKVSAARKAAFEESSKYSERQNAYADIFKNAFAGMTDAIVNFAKTGKLSFTDLINNMVEGILRYELQLQAMAMWAAAKPGMMSFIGQLFGTGGGAPEALGNASGAWAPTPSLTAKGAAYDNGIKKFATGGAFSNSIVSSPTMFKFAKGTGLMGEAGPEAIMPLKRDSNGNLGVRGPSGQGGGSNVEVIVNNYGTEKAKTTQSTDSRGNRKIEVIIGDASAAEITRNGSSSQRSMRSTYGLQPQLVRR